MYSIFISCFKSNGISYPAIFTLNNPALELKIIRLFCEKTAFTEKSNTKTSRLNMHKVIDKIPNILIFFGIFIPAFYEEDTHYWSRKIKW